MTPLVLTTRTGPTAILTLNRVARHNSFIPLLLEELLAALAGLEKIPLCARCSFRPTAIRFPLEGI